MKKIYYFTGVPKLAILCCVLFFSISAFGQFYKPGNVPTLWPTGGFGAEGDGYNNTWIYPTPAVTNNVGDWFPYLDPNPPVGSGGSVFDANGNLVPVTPDLAIIAHFLDKYKKDPGGDQSVFAMSDKINDNPNTYNVKAGSVPPKDDIQHATAVFTWGNASLVQGAAGDRTGYVQTGNPDDLWCLFAGDRWTTNGDSYIDFEFNQARITWDLLTGDFTTFAPVLDAAGDPTGGRTPGDLLLTIHFLNGGAIGEVFVDKWMNDGLHTAYSWHTQNVMNAPYLTNLFMVFNNVVTHAPWPIYDQAPLPDGHYAYAINQFAEGAINLTQTMLQGQECGTIATVWARTKSSHSTTAQLKDLAGIMTVDIPVPIPVATCPDPVELPACSSLEDIQDEWDDWVAGFSYTDGTEPVSEFFDPELPESLPENVSCGWEFEVEYLVVDHCGQRDSCTSTFTVEEPEPVEVTCPDDTIVTYLDAADFLTQEQIDVLFAEWLTGFEYSGGCNPEPSPLDYDAPNNCGGAVTVTFSATDDCDQSDECSATFTVNNQIEATVSCPDDPLLPACTLQADIQDAYEDWVDEFIVIEACPPYVTNIADVPLLPDNAECEGVSLEFTFTVDDACDQHAECTSTFTVGEPEDIGYTAPEGFDADACDYADQLALETAFDTWLSTETADLESSISGGCDPEVSNDWDGTYPVLCEGGDITVEWTIEDLCETIYLSATFSLDAPEAIGFTEPEGDQLNSCGFVDQAALDAAFDTWLDGETQALELSITGGCEPEVTNDWDGIYLDLCEGGDITVEWTITDLCETLYTSATFSVEAPEDISYTAPEGLDLDACDYADQASLDAAFDEWLDGETEALELSILGGCDPEVTNDWDGIYLDLCEGGEITVEWTITDLCETIPTSATFSVDAPEDITFTPPEGDDLDACGFADQAELDAAFDAWLDGETEALDLSILGGCEPEVTDDWDGIYLELCEGGEITVEWTIEDLCETQYVSATFSVDAPEEISYSDVEGLTVAACDFADQAGLEAAFDEWLDGETEALELSIVGGCDPEVTNDWDGEYPQMCEGSITVEWTIDDLCESFTSSATFNVTPPEAIEVICPDPVDLAACTPSADVIAAYEAWRDGFTESGDCILDDNMDSFPPLVILPDGSVDLSFTFIVTGLCDDAEHTCTSTFTMGPCAPNCGTVFAKLDNDVPGGPDVPYARCFEEDGFSRWGWTNYIPEEGVYTMNIYGGAAHCIYTPEELEGTVVVTYSGGELTVEYFMDAGFSLSEVHVNVACDMYPVGHNGEPTVAPGQYIFGAGGFGYLSDLTVTFTDVEGAVWVIVHGIGCDEEAEGSSSFEYDDPIHCPPIAASFGKHAVVIPAQSNNEIDVNIHPNPFIGSTDIDFSIPVSGQATVEVYNTLGEKVLTLYEGFVDANQKYFVKFTPPDQSGQGTFLCVIRSAKGYIVKPMVLTR